MSPGEVPLGQTQADPEIFLTCSEINDHFSEARHADAEHQVHSVLLRRCRTVCELQACSPSEVCLLPVSSTDPTPKPFVDAEHKRRYLASTVRWCRHAESIAGPGHPPGDGNFDLPSDRPSPERVAMGVEMLDRLLAHRRARKIADDKAVLGRSKEIDRSRVVAERLLVSLVEVLTIGGPEVWCRDLLPMGETDRDRQRRSRALDGARQLLLHDGATLGLTEATDGLVDRFCAPGH